MKPITRNGKPLPFQEPFSTETQFVRKLVIQTFSSLHMEGSLERSLRYPQEILDENFPGKFLLEATNEKGIVTYRLTTVATGELVIAISKSTGYFTEEDIQMILDS